MPVTQGGRSSRRTLALLALTLTLVFVAAACGGKSETQLAADELAAGLVSDNAGNQADASTHYLACLKHEATNKYCLYNLGHIAQTQNQTAQAENYYRQALAQDPNFPAPIFNLAILRTGLGDTAGAIALYRQYVALSPTDAGGHLNLGLLLRATGDQAGAATELAAAIKLNPKLVIPPLQSAAPSAAPSAEPTAIASAEPSAVATTHYTVLKGDSWGAIATKFQTTKEILWSLNGLPTARPLVEGESILVPAS